MNMEDLAERNLRARRLSFQRFAAGAFAEPAAAVECELRRLFDGPLVGGGHRTSGFEVSADRRSATITVGEFVAVITP